MTKHPLLEFAKQDFFIPRAFREKMAQCRSMVGMKALMMQIGQGPANPFVVSASII
jgi:hypothetical protein